MIGYLTIYFKVTFEDEAVAFSKLNLDFRKPITEEVFEDFTNSIKTLYEETIKKSVKTVESIPVEEYEANENPEDHGKVVSFTEKETIVKEF